ncbi:hypothetical protein WN55_08003 [Dufourea novaeangliae]|uniref:Uncharacterized protein n=1 Tax=Dufourea novaeangliae TaxID=178035 RepID=A0A154P774_DUFNO|nr:hypothetical protein WN55_08003 [Dufourea novaeangliae]
MPITISGGRGRTRRAIPTEEQREIEKDGNQWRGLDRDGASPNALEGAGRSTEEDETKREKERVREWLGGKARGWTVKQKLNDEEGVK